MKGIYFFLLNRAYIPYAHPFFNPKQKLAGEIFTFEMNISQVMTITTTDIQLYEILRQKLGNAEAEALVDFVDSKLKTAHEDNLKNLATKEDLKDVELKLSVKISETKTDIIRWVFTFFIPLMLAIIGLYVRK